MSLLHTITFIISFHGSSCSSQLSSSLSLGLIDVAVYARDLFNRWLCDVPLALERRRPNKSFPRTSGKNVRIWILRTVKFYCANGEKLWISNCISLTNKFETWLRIWSTALLFHSLSYNKWQLKTGIQALVGFSTKSNTADNASLSLKQYDTLQMKSCRYIIFMISGTDTVHWKPFWLQQS